MLAGPWTVAKKVPGDCEKALQAAIDEKVADMLVGGDPSDPKSAPTLAKQVPRIFVETKPAELLVFEGAPKFVPIEGTKLMYAENTTGHLFVHADDQQAYLLASGRWFRGPSALNGPWVFVAGDALPKDFAAIPDDEREGERQGLGARDGTGSGSRRREQRAADRAGHAQRREVRAGVRRRAEARADRSDDVAVRRQHVSARSSPSEARLRYFGVQNGVWFVSNSLDGPWLVATTVPAVIYSIPASSPLHYVTYVKIYDSTPEEVVVGYTPGYTGAYA